MRQISYKFLISTVFVSTLSSGLSGCGEVSYKRGGSAQDVSRAHEVCRGTGDGFSKCLEQQGWQAQHFKSFDPLFATVSVSENRPNPTQNTVESKQELAQQNNAEPSTVNDGPDVSYSINSWWKMGAGPEALNKDQQMCEKTLGDPYKPDYRTYTFKRAFVSCMHEKGWIAVRNITIK